MKRFATLIFFVLFAILPVASFAMSHGEQGMQGPAEEESRVHTGQETMSTTGQMFIVGDLSTRGVRGMAHLKDVRAAMANLNLTTTHHFMIAFVDEKTGEQIESGKVALKVKGPDGGMSDTVELVGMQGHFGADIALKQTGGYEFLVGTELPDGVKRTFDFHWEMQ